MFSLPTITRDFSSVQSVGFFFAFSEGVKLSLCLHVCVSVCVPAWVYTCLSPCPRGHIGVCVRKLCVCVSLLLLASNWIFCPEFCLSLWAEEKQRKGTTPSIVVPFELSPTHLQNKRQGQDWIEPKHTFAVAHSRLKTHVTSPLLCKC